MNKLGRIILKNARHIYQNVERLSMINPDKIRYAVDPIVLQHTLDYYQQSIGQLSQTKLQKWETFIEQQMEANVYVIYSPDNGGFYKRTPYQAVQYVSSFDEQPTLFNGNDLYLIGLSDGNIPMYLSQEQIETYQLTPYVRPLAPHEEQRQRLVYQSTKEQTVKQFIHQWIKDMQLETHDVEETRQLRRFYHQQLTQSLKQLGLWEQSLNPTGTKRFSNALLYFASLFMDTQTVDPLWVSLPDYLNRMMYQLGQGTRGSIRWKVVYSTITSTFIRQVNYPLLNHIDLK